MMTPSSIRLRRGQPAIATQKLIVFRLRQEQFALPIQFAYRVVEMGQVYGAQSESSVGLMVYQGRELLVLDIDRLVYASPPPLRPQLPSTTAEQHKRTTHFLSPQCLLILKTTQGNLVGLPLPSQPELQRVPESAFVPVPANYLAQGHIRCISALVVVDPTSDPLFLLNLNQLIQPPQRVSQSLLQ